MLVGVAVIGVALLAAALWSLPLNLRTCGPASEPTTNLRRLFDASISYYTRHDRFPDTTALTPGAAACRDGQPVKHAPTHADWRGPTWAALRFALHEPFRYQYAYVSDGQSFTARVIGDLDCDGVLSTFERVGFIDAEGNVNGGAGTFKKDELE